MLRGVDKKQTEVLREKVGEAVERNGYSQREIAGILGVHYSSISRMMNFKKNQLQHLRPGPLPSDTITEIHCNERQEFFLSSSLLK